MIRVRPSHMRSWVKDRSEVLAPSTLAVVWSNVTSMFAAAVADRVIGTSPCTGVTLPEVAHRRHYIPSDEQVHELSAGLPEQTRTMDQLSAMCPGCALTQRREEECTGRWFGCALFHL
jgi:hypothetical protein